MLVCLQLEGVSHSCAPKVWKNLQFSKEIQRKSKLSTASQFPTERLRNLDFGSNIAVFGSGRGLNGRGALVGFIWTEFQFKKEPWRPISRPTQSRVCNQFQLGSSRELGNLPSDFQDCFRATQRVLGLAPIWCSLRTEQWRPVS